jgi:hypothetical protein
VGREAPALEKTSNAERVKVQWSTDRFGEIPKHFAPKPAFSSTIDLIKNAGLISL